MMNKTSFSSKSLLSFFHFLVTYQLCFFFFNFLFFFWLPYWLSSKESACNEGNTCSMPGSRKSNGGGNGNPMQYSCLENPLDRGAWWATVHWGHKELDLT